MLPLNPYQKVQKEQHFKYNISDKQFLEESEQFKYQNLINNPSLSFLKPNPPLVNRSALMPFIYEKGSCNIYKGNQSKNKNKSNMTAKKLYFATSIGNYQIEKDQLEREFQLSEDRKISKIKSNKKLKQSLISDRKLQSTNTLKSPLKFTPIKNRNAITSFHIRMSQTTKSNFKFLKVYK